MIDNPLVSIVIPTYNRAELVTQAIVSALQQDYKPIEIIVIDDGSTDETSEQISKFGNRVNYWKTKNNGQSAARNFGVHLAKADFIAFLDDDDLFDKKKTSLQMQIFNTYPETALVACQTKQQISGKNIEEAILTSQRKKRGYVPFEEIASTPHTSIAPSASIFRKKDFIENGGFDTGITHGEDWDLVIRIASKKPVYFLDEPLVIAQSHTHSRFSIYYLDYEKATRRYKDHVNVIHKMGMISNPKIADIQSRAQNLNETEYAINEIANGYKESGLERLKNAIISDPGKWSRDQEYDGLIFNYSQEILINYDWEKARKFLFDIWDPSLPIPIGIRNKILRHHQGKLALDAALMAAFQKNFRNVRKYARIALCLEPKQITNRGLLSVFLASFFGYSSLAELRARHQK